MSLTLPLSGKNQILEMIHILLLFTLNSGQEKTVCAVRSQNEDDPDGRADALKGAKLFLGLGAGDRGAFNRRKFTLLNTYGLYCSACASTSINSFKKQNKRKQNGMNLRVPTTQLKKQDISGPQAPLSQHNVLLYPHALPRRLSALLQLTKRIFPLRTQAASGPGPGHRAGAGMYAEGIL